MRTLLLRIAMTLLFSVGASFAGPGAGAASAAQVSSAGGGSNRVPVISSIYPPSIDAGSAGFTLSVTGQNFSRRSVVRWNNSDHPTTYVDSTYLRASIPASDIGICLAGIAQVTVFNPQAWGSTSNAASFTINNPLPSLTALSSSTVLAGGPAFTLRVSGTGFACTSVVRWNGIARSTTFVDPTLLLAAIPAFDLATAGSAQIQVSNPAPGGGGSNPITLAIVNPVPQLTALSPATAAAYSASLLLTVSGQFFLPSSTARWNGNDRPTTYVDSTQLQVQVSASDLFAPGTAAVTVFNPQPGGGESQAFSFTINPPSSNPLPVITSLSDTQAPASWPGFSLVVRGSGFAADSTMQWNGLNRPTTVVDGTELRAAIAGGDLASAGTAQVAVFNPSPGGGTSNTLSFTITPVASDAVGVIEQSSVNAQFEPGNSDSPQGVLSADGRYAAFSSDANNLVPNDTNGVSDVFLRDTCRGPSAPAGCAPSIVRISVTDDGSEAAFEAPPAADFDYEYYWDQGLVVVVDCTPSGAYDANVVIVCLSFGSFVGSISPDGRFVIFSSDAINLVANDSNHLNDVFVRDTCIGAPSGCAPSTFRASVAGNGIEASAESSGGAISANGRFIAFHSDASNLVANDTNSFSDVFLRDTCFGASAGCTPSTIRVSVASDGTEGNHLSDAGSLSADGRFVVFSSAASNLVPNDTNGLADVFLRDTCLGASAGCTPSTLRVSVASDGTPGDRGSARGMVSASGRFITFYSYASNLVANDTNNSSDVFVYDTCFNATACSPSTMLVSVATDGTQANNASSGGVISADGRLIAFESDATNLVSNDGNGVRDVFIRDTCVGAQPGCVPRTWRVSVTLDGTQGDDWSFTPRLSADGRYLAFVSKSGNLAPGDSNQKQDVFVARTGHR